MGLLGKLKTKYLLRVVISIDTIVLSLRMQRFSYQSSFPCTQDVIIITILVLRNVLIYKG